MPGEGVRYFALKFEGTMDESDEDWSKTAQATFDRVAKELDLLANRYGGTVCTVDSWGHIDD